MTDDHLRHLCKLSAVAAGSLSDKREWVDYMMKADRNELGDQFTCLAIMAEAFVELMNRAGMKPTFRVSSRIEDHP